MKIMKYLKYIIAALTGTLLVPALAFAITVQWNKIAPGQIYPPLVNDMVGIGTTTPKDQLSVATSTQGKGITVTNTNSPCLDLTENGSTHFLTCESNADANALSNIVNMYDGAYILKGSPFGGAYMDFVNQNAAGGFTFAFGSNQTDNSRGVNIIPNTLNKGQILVNTTVANDSASISLGGNNVKNAIDFWDGGVGFPMRISASSTVMEFDLGNTLSNSAQFRSSVGSTNPVFDVIAGGGVGIGTSSPSANGGLAIAAGTGSGVFSRSLVIADNTGAEKFLFHSDGTEWINTALGIGTTSPTGALAVVGGFFTTASSTGMNGINLTGGCFSVRGVCITGGGGGSGTVNSGIAGQFPYYAANGTTLTATSTLTIGTTTGDIGNIGIGTTSPTAKLAVSPGAASTLGLVVEGDTNQSQDIQQWLKSDHTVLNRLDPTGNFIFQNDGAGVIADAGGFYRIGFMKYSGQFGALVHNSSSPFQIFSNSSADIRTLGTLRTDMQITSGGSILLNPNSTAAANIGIGTTSPFTDLSVNGTTASNFYSGTGRPTIAAGGTYSDAVVSLDPGSDNFSGRFHVNVKTIVGSPGDPIATITFGSSFTKNANCPIYPMDKNSGAAQVFSTTTATTLSVNQANTSLLTNTTYGWFYICGKNN